MEINKLDWPEDDETPPSTRRWGLVVVVRLL